jgi:hypothetical protein
MSKTILLSLIGKEPTGNFRAYKEFGPNVLIHVFSDVSVETSEKILSLVDKNTQIVKIKIEADNYSQILESLVNLNLDISPDDHININVTGGTKMMCLASIDFGKLLEQKCKVSYLYTDINTQKIHWFYENKSESFCEEFELEEYIVLRGQKIKSKDNYTDLIEKFEDALQELKDILKDQVKLLVWNKFLNSYVSKVRKLSSNSKNKSTSEIIKLLDNENTGSKFRIIWNDNLFQIFHLDMVLIEIELKKEDIDWFVFNGGWFELLTANKLAKKYDSNKMYMNVKFPVLKDVKLDKNEVDILINDGGKLIFVECKSGNLYPEAINSIKVREETYGGEIGKSLLITRFDMFKEKNDSAKVIIDKCKDLNIQLKTYNSL